MILSYCEAVNMFGTDYRLNIALKNNNIYKVSKGVYSDIKYPDELVYLNKKYDDFIITLQSAFLYYDLSNYIPEVPTILTLENSYHISKDLVKQYYTNDKYYSIGVVDARIENVKMKIFDKERLLIELIRYETKIQVEEYRHVLGNYRKILNDLDFRKIYEYASCFKEHKKIYNTIRNILI